MPLGNPAQALVRRLSGDGLLNLWIARQEVLTATGHGRWIPNAPALADALDPQRLPSHARLGATDRPLAEIDQEGFAFAVEPEDEPVFNRRTEKAPRFGHRVEIILHGGRVCVRKTFRGPVLGARAHGRPMPLPKQAQQHLWASLGFGFFTEAAALLRMRSLAFVPKLRSLDVGRHVLVMDFIPGSDLRRLAAREGTSRNEPVFDADVGRRDDLAGLDELALNRREVRLLDAAGLGGFREALGPMVAAMNAVGVAPLDIKAGNLLRAEGSGRLYWLDFERARLATQPRWREDLAHQRKVMRDLFEIELRDVEGTP